MRPNVPRVLPLAQAIFDLNAMGCCLHIVLADMNVEDKSVDFCVERALASGHDDCLDVAKLLHQITRTQRARISRLIKYK